MAWFSRPLLHPLRPQLQSARQMVENVEHRMDRDPPRPGLVFSESSPAGTSSLQPSQPTRSEEHTSELQSLRHLVCRLLLEKKTYWPIARPPFRVPLPCLLRWVRLSHP